MIMRVCTLLFVAAVATTMTAQSEPVLTSANIPQYPALARQARIEGVVKLTFTLPANGAEPTKVEAMSGHPAFKAAAVENVKTWRLKNPYTVERNYQTTFEYRLLGVAERVTFESFHHVEIVTDALPQTESNF
jgi:TonB family protein